jgi:hypothetical protein
MRLGVEHERKQIFTAGGDPVSKLTQGMKASIHSKRVAPVRSVTHRQNVNVATHIRRCPRHPATVHKITTKRSTAVTHAVKPVFRRLPSASQTQRPPQTNHIAGESYRVVHLGSNRLAVIRRSGKAFGTIRLKSRSPAFMQCTRASHAYNAQTIAKRGRGI